MKCSRCCKEFESQGLKTCDPCRAHAKMRRTENLDFERQRSRAYRAAHIEDVRAKNRHSQAIRRAAKPEEHKADCREWYYANRAHVLAYKRQWRVNNPDAFKAQTRRKNSLRRARKYGAAMVPFTSEQLAARFRMFAGCWICGAEATEEDHVKPLSKGGPHILSNLRPICSPCNMWKNSFWYGPEHAHWLRELDRGVPISATAVELIDGEGVSRWMTSKRAEQFAKERAS